MSKKRAFVRYTKSGEIVPGSLIITTNGGYPDKSSLWQEVTVDQCCEETGEGCQKETVVIPINLSSTPAPYTYITIEIVCKAPQVVETYVFESYPGFTTLEELFSYFNQTTDNIEISVVSPTEISVTYCKRKVNCPYEDSPCFGYVLNVNINGDGVASVCNINN